MNDISIVDDWPAPSSVPAVGVHADESSLWLRYSTADDTVAVLFFPLVETFRFGAPNDEALGGHPLYGNGLQFYSIHRINDSSWIQELEKQNSVHPQHDRASFLKDHTHYIFTFQDSTLECVVVTGEHWKPTIEVCSSDDEANRIWKERIGA